MDSPVTATALAEPDGDQLDRTARQVYLPAGRTCDRAVHELVAAEADDTGRLYRTLCRQVLAAREGAVLTTRDTTCARCLNGGEFNRLVRQGTPDGPT